AQVTRLLAFGGYMQPAGAAPALTSRPMAPAVPTPSVGRSPCSEQSIAVLPFVDMSQNKDQEYFSDGLTEELIGLLTRVPELRVPARTSCFYFKSKQATIADIARALNVAHVLEGSVRKAGNTIRIAVQLIRADTGYHLWSQSYDRTLDDIFKVQDEIAGSVVRSLCDALLSATLPARSAALNSESYQLYLRGHFHWNRRSPEEFRKAITFFQQAIAVDPDYALAFTGLANCYSLLPIYDRTSQATQTMPQARTAILRALAIDDNLAEAHASLGLRQTQLDGEPATEVAALKEAFAKDSWPGFLQLRIRSLEAQGQPDCDEIAAFSARVGDLDRAFAWLEKSYAGRSPRLTHLKVDARYDNLRADARFADMLRRVGLGS